MREVSKGSVLAAMLCLLLIPPSTAMQRTGEDELNDDAGVVEVELVPGTTSGNYSSIKWGPKAMCAPGSFAFAFQLKTEPIMLFGDFTGLNAVMLYCLEKDTGKLMTGVTSNVGRWGLWGVIHMCTAGLLKGVKMRVEQPEQAPKGDKSAVNNLAMECENGERMVGDGATRGQWGEWQRCPEGSAICGLATQVVQPQSVFSDDVSLISAAFYCCPF